MTELFGVPLDWRLAMVTASVVLGGFLRGFVGFGGALVSVPVLSLAFGPHMALAVSSVMSLPSTFQLLPDAIRHAERPVVVPMGIAVLLTAPIGMWIHMSVSQGLMKIVISGLVVAMTLMLASGWKFKGAIGKPALVAAGIAGGLIQGSAGIGGPPVVAIALSRPGGAVSQRGTVLGVMTSIGVASLLPLAWYGLFTRASVVLGALLLPVYMVSVAFGSRYFALGGHAHYRRAALATLLAVGLTTMVVAVRGYVAG